MVQSRDHGYLCTVGADERMKFWCVEETVKDPFMPAARRQTESFSRLL